MIYINVRWINAKLEALKTLDEMLTRVEATGDQTLPENNRHNTTDNPPIPDAQYLKSIKINVPNFDGCYDLQLFIDWTLQLDRYFT